RLQTARFSHHPYPSQLDFVVLLHAFLGQNYACHSSLLRTRPPPRSTLFPYTTLFRSHPEPGRHRHRIGRAHHPWEQPHLPDGQVDRKSTRLNSSHGSISYAVFCLKKKRST